MSTVRPAERIVATTALTQFNEIRDVEDHQEVVGERVDDREGTRHRATSHDEWNECRPREPKNENQHDERNKDRQ
jgi:hypothetical protein